MNRIAVVGGGQAAASLVRKLRLLGFDGQIRLFSREPALPYNRPPLSKAFLVDGTTAEDMAIFPASFYSDNAVDLVLPVNVSGIDPAGKTLEADGETVAYDRLVLATGAAARPLPHSVCGTLKGVHTLRTIADARSLGAEMTAGGRVLVVGGGYIGLETAATASRLGLAVTVVELGARVLQRVATPALSNAVSALHRANGIDLREGVGVVELAGETRVTRAALSDGTSVAVDLVIVGTGAIAETGIAESAGLRIENGIWTDSLGCTSHPDIHAIGDCASFPHNGRQLRLESVQNAIDHAEATAENIMGRGRPYNPLPTFWSEQFDALVQIAGLCGEADKIVTRTGPQQNQMSFWSYGRDGLSAVEAVNDTRTFAMARRMIERGISPPPEAITDSTTNLKGLLRP